MRIIDTLRRLSAILLVVGTAVTAGACTDVLDPAGDDAYITVRNESAEAIYFVYFSRCASNSWGLDRLSSGEVIMPDAEKEWEVEPGCYDLKAEFATGGEATRFGVNVEEGYTQIWTLF